MAFCIQCGHELHAGVKFCEVCGAQVECEDEDDILEACNEFFADDEEEEDVDEDEAVEEVEDGDDEIDTKDFDASHGYYMSFEGRNATLYRDDGVMVRRFRMHSDILQATTTGETVSIVTSDGYATIFSWTGQLIRRIRQRH